MAKPPASPPSSDIDGVNRDARVNTPSTTHPDPGGVIARADTGSVAKPDEAKPSEDKGG